MTRTRTKWLATFAAAALLAGLPLATLSPVRAQDAATSQPVGKASITVTVLDQDKKPVPKTRVRLMSAKPADGDARPTPVATGRTDDDGKATLTGIADGDYMVNAGSRAAGTGREKITISNGADASVSVTLKPRKARGNAAPASPSTQPT
jgi:hypothetical protein